MIVDSSAVVAILIDETDGPDLERALLMAPAPVMSAATLLESHIVMRRRFGEAGVSKVDRLVREAAIRVVAVDEIQVRTASRGHADFGRGSGHPAKLNYGDCFSYALAIERDEPLLFTGDDFVHTDVRQASSGR
ncbi:type II toxin-antitoxin system VapC family toxin [Microbacterium maritypicum]